MINVNEIVKDIHTNAVEHGWWDNERSFGEVIALCHSELSEALEADRASEPVLYFNGNKPEGVAVEMIDCVIRIFDWCGHAGIDVEDIIKAKHNYNVTRPYKHGKKY